MDRQVDRGKCGSACQEVKKEQAFDRPNSVASRSVSDLPAASSAALFPVHPRKRNGVVEFY